jgi:MerR family transcriptional regulator/heat shock protein HspR
MSFYTRKQVIEVLEVDDGFLVSLEREEIIASDAPAEEAGKFSERMLERARVANNLVRDLDVNLAGVAVIVRLREEMAELHRRVEQLAREMRPRS